MSLERTLCQAQRNLQQPAPTISHRVPSAVTLPSPHSRPPFHPQSSPRSAGRSLGPSPIRHVNGHEGPKTASRLPGTLPSDLSVSTCEGVHCHFEACKKTRRQSLCTRTRRWRVCIACSRGQDGYPDGWRRA